MYPILPKIKHFILLLEEWNKCQSEDIDSDHSPINSSDIVFDDCSKELLELEKFRDSLTLDELNLIRSIMYSGRDNKFKDQYITLKKQFDEIKKLDNDKEIIFHGMLEDNLLNDYLKDGIKYHQKELLEK